MLAELEQTVSGPVIEQNGWRFTVVLAVAVLSPIFGSAGEVADTEAEFASGLMAEEETLATIVIVADEPASIEGKVTVRALPEPPQAPLAVALQERNVAPDGRLSMTVTDVAWLGPLLVTVRV